MRTIRRLCLALAVAMLGLLAGLTGAGIARAAGVTYTVAPGGTASCTSGVQNGTNFGTIQGAIDCATADNPPASNPDTIQIAAGTYYEHLGIISTNVNLVGAGAAIVDGSGNATVVTIDVGTVGISNLTIQDGSAFFGGGIADNGGTVTLDNSTVTGNTGQLGGGGIDNYGTLTLDNSSVTGNTAASNGGGILNHGTATLDNSSVTGNTASYGGGGIANTDTLTLDNSSVRDNTAYDGGGGIFNSGTATLDNSSVKNNTAANYGGGIFNTPDRTVNLINSTVSKNTPTNCFGTVSGCKG